MKKMQNRIPSIDDFFGKDAEGHILIDERIGGVIDAFGSRIAQSLKMSFLGNVSGNARLEKGLKGAFAKDIVDNKLPILNLLGDFMGYNVKSYVAKNPDALMQLISMPQVQGILGKYLGVAGKGNSPGIGTVDYGREE